MSLPDGGKSFDDMCIHLEDTIPECDVQMDGFAIAISRSECLRVIKSKSCVWVCTCFSKWTANHCYSDLKRLLLPPRLLNGPQLAGLLQHVHAVALDVSGGFGITPDSVMLEKGSRTSAHFWSIYWYHGCVQRSHQATEGRLLPHRGVAWTVLQVNNNNIQSVPTPESEIAFWQVNLIADSCCTLLCS